MRAHAEPTTILAGLTPREQEIEDRIAAAWDAVTAAQGRGECSDAQVRHLFAQEAAWGDDGRVTTRWVFMHYLEAQARRPQMIGVNLRRDGDAPYSCRCEDSGFLIDEKSDKPIPCPDCNTNLYELYSAGCLRPNHECEKCKPKEKRRRARAGDTHREEITDARRAEEQIAVVHDLFDGYQTEAF